MKKSESDIFDEEYSGLVRKELAEMIELKMRKIILKIQDMEFGDDLCTEIEALYNWSEMFSDLALLGEPIRWTFKEDI